MSNNTEFEPNFEQPWELEEPPFYLAGETVEGKQSAVLITAEEFRQRTTAAREPEGSLGLFTLESVQYSVLRAGSAIKTSEKYGTTFYGVPGPRRQRDLY